MWRPGPTRPTRPATHHEGKALAFYRSAWRGQLVTMENGAWFCSRSSCWPRLHFTPARRGWLSYAVVWPLAPLADRGGSAQERGGKKKWEALMAGQVLPPGWYLPKYDLAKPKIHHSYLVGPCAPAAKPPPARAPCSSRQRCSWLMMPALPLAVGPCAPWLPSLRTCRLPADHPGG